MSFFKENDIEVEFFDFKKETPTSTSIKSWVQKAGIDVIFNSKGTKYRTLKLKDLNLDDEGKYKWLCDEPMLLKRPIVEHGDSVTVGFKEEIYKETFL